MGEQSYLMLLYFLLYVFIDDCISLFNISRKIEKPEHLHLSTELNIFIKQSTVRFI